MPGIFLDFGDTTTTQAIGNSTTASLVDITDSTVVDLSSTQSIDNLSDALTLSKLLLPDPIVSYVGVRFSNEYVSSQTISGGSTSIVFEQKYGDGSNVGSSTTTGTVSIPSSDVNNTRYYKRTYWYEIINPTTWNYIGIE